MPESQMAALIMAIFFKDMAAQETAVFADEMILTGETLDLSHITRPKVANTPREASATKPPSFSPRSAPHAGLSSPE